MITKQQYTEKLLDALPQEERVSLDQACKIWWTDFRDDGGMRLTQQGYDAFTIAWDLETYIFKIPPGLPARPGQLLTLKKKLNCPYFIKLGKKPELVLFDSKQATMLALYGDLEKFLLYLDRT